MTTNISPQDAKQILDDLKNSINNISVSGLMSGMTNVLSSMQQTVSSTNDLNVALDSISDAQKQINSRLSKYERMIQSNIALIPDEQQEYLELLNISEQLTNEEIKRGAEIRKTTSDIAKQKETLATIKTVVGGIWGAVKQGADKWLEIDEIAKNTAKHTAMNKEESVAYHKALTKNARELAYDYGMTVSEIAKLQDSYADITGKARILNREQLEHTTAMSKLVGDDITNQFIENMDNMGSDTDAATLSLANAFNKANKLGLNAVKTSKDFAKNLSMANKFAFKNGVDGVMKMTMLSEKLKFNLESMGSVIDNFSDIDSAIETSAKIQMLGGEMAAEFGNALTNFSDAMIDPEALIERFAKSFETRGTFNKETGQVDISPIELRRIREQAKAVGMNPDEAVTIAKQSARNASVDKTLNSNLSDTEKTLIENKAQYDTKTQSWYIQHGDKRIDTKTIGKDSELLKEIQKEEEPLKDIRKNVEDIAMAFVSDKDKLKGFQEQILLAESEAIDKLMRSIEKLSDSILANHGGANLLGSLNGWLIMFGHGLTATIGNLGAKLLEKKLFNGGKPISSSKIFKGGLGRSIKRFGIKTIGKATPWGLAAMGTDAINYIGKKTGTWKEGSHADKGMNIGSAALQGAGIGAAIGTIFPGIGNAIGAGVGAAVGATVGAVTEYWDDIKKFGIDSWNGISDWASETWDNISGAAAKSWGDVSKWASETWNDISSAVSKSWDWVSNKFVDYVAKPLMTVGDLLLTPFKVLSNVVEKIANVLGFGDKFASAKNWVSENIPFFGSHESGMEEGIIGTKSQSISVPKQMGDYLRNSGDDGFATVKRGEFVSTPEQMSNIVNNYSQGLTNQYLDAVKSDIRPTEVIGSKTNITPNVPSINVTAPTPSTMNLNINGSIKLDASSLGGMQKDIDITSLLENKQVKDKLVEIISREFASYNGKIQMDSGWYKTPNFMSYQ